MNSSLRILLLEDMPADAELVEDRLREDGLTFTMHVVANKGDFERALEEQSPDLVLTDHTLPQYDGLAAIKLVKKRRPEVPIIVVTGALGDERAVQLLREGAADYVLKDRLARLAPAVRHAIEVAKHDLQLRESQEKYRLLFSGVHDGVAMLDAEAGLITDCNPAFEHMVGQSLDSLQCKTIWELRPPDIQDKARARFLDDRTTGAGAYSDLPFQTPDGSRIDVEVFIRAIALGTGRYLIYTCRDITERTRAEAERAERERVLAAERHRLFDVLEALPAMICLIAEDYHVPFANRAFRQQFGDASGRRCYEYCFSQTAPCDFCQSFEVMKTGTPHDWEVRTPDGRVISVHDVPFTEADGTRLILELDLDITEQRRVEDALRDLNQSLERRVTERTAELVAANAELESFAYSVSHDLRAPLRSIDGFSAILQEDYSDKLDAEGQRLLDVMRSGAVKMGQLIDDILAFSRAGRTAMNVSEVDMTELVRAVIADPLAPATAGRKIAIDVAELPPARDDRAMLERVWVNLIDNAIKYSAPKPAARVEIGAKIAERENVYFVRDNGVGFDMQYVDKLFGVFQRLHGAEIPGTGIGLAIVKRLVLRHGGRVWAEGKPGEGATFYFTIPTVGNDA